MDEDKEIIEIIRSLILFDIVMGSLLILSIWLTDVNNLLHIFTVVGLLIILIVTILATFLARDIYKLHKLQESTPDDQKELQYEEFLKKSFIFRFCMYLYDRFFSDGELKETHVQKVLLNEDGLNFIGRDQTVFRVVPWFDIKKVRFWGKIRHGCNFIFMLKDGKEYYLCTSFRKKEGEIFLKKIRDNIKKHRDGEAIGSDDYAGEFAYKYFEKREEL
jgi:hypothetical protein